MRCHEKHTIFPEYGKHRLVESRKKLYKVWKNNGASQINSDVFWLANVSKVRSG